MKTEKSKTWAEIRRIFFTYKVTLFLLCVVVILSSVLALLNPLFLKFIFDDVIGKSRIELLKPVMVALFVVMLLGTCFSFLLKYIMSYFMGACKSDLKLTVYKTICGIPFEVFRQKTSESYINHYIIDISTVLGFVGGGITFILNFSISFVFIVAVLAYYNTFLTMLTFLFVPLHGIVFFCVKKTLSDKYSKLRNIQDEELTLFRDCVHGKRTIDLFLLFKQKFTQYKDKLFYFIREALSCALTENGLSSILSIP